MYKAPASFTQPFQSSLKNNLWKLKVIRLLFWMHFFSAVLVPFYTDFVGLKLSHVLFLNSWFMFWNFALEVPTGTVADYLGRRVSLILGCIVGALAAGIYVSAPGFITCLIAEFVFAIAYTLHSGADEALAYDSLKQLGSESKSKALLSTMESYKLAGITLATVVGGFIASSYGLAAPMKAYAIPSLLALGFALTLKEPDPDAPPSGTRSYLTILKEGASFFSKHRILLILTTELAVTNAFAWGIIWLFQPLLERAGVPIQYFGVIHALSAVGQIALLSNVEKIEARVGSKRKLLLGMSAVTGIAFIGLGTVQHLIPVALLIIAAFTFSLPRIPLFSSYMNKHIPSEKRATVLSFTSMVRTFSIVVINVLIGILADRSLSMTMIALGSLILLATFISRIEERHLVD